jgi:hypothetical protein
MTFYPLNFINITDNMPDTGKSWQIACAAQKTAQIP